jgi:outer membrane biosynthesis protein TonB
MVELKPQDKTPPKPEAHNDKPPGPPGPKGPASNEGTNLGGGGGNGDNIGGDGGTVFGYYASQVGDQVRAALSRNDKTRNASFRIKVRVWADANGRITHAALAESTGDPAVDAAIQNQVLVGLQLQQPPPQNMPMPIIMMIREQRPS